MVVFAWFVGFFCLFLFVSLFSKICQITKVLKFHSYLTDHLCSGHTGINEGLKVTQDSQNLVMHRR